jgi:hypothetical protein
MVKYLGEYFMKRIITILIIQMITYMKVINIILVVYIILYMKRTLK